jgi:hypothetical protein
VPIANLPGEAKMTVTGDITLIEESTAGNPPKVYAAQRLEIRSVPSTIVVGVDGNRSVGDHPSEILWHGGTAADLAHITNVRITDTNGAVLIDGSLNTFHTVPHDVSGGVRFDVLVAT